MECGAHARFVEVLRPYLPKIDPVQVSVGYFDRLEGATYEPCSFTGNDEVISQTAFGPEQIDRENMTEYRIFGQDG